MTPQNVRLRDVLKTDLDIFFQHSNDKTAIQMAAFTSDDPTDRAGFDEFWQKIIANPAIVTQTILANDAVAGHILKHHSFGDPEVTYWLGQDFWGQGIATQALGLLLGMVVDRPIFGRVVKDNIGSRRVLEKCGFAVVDTDRGFANGRGAEVDELILRLD